VLKLSGIAALFALFVTLPATAQDLTPAAMLDAQAQLAYRLLTGIPPDTNLTVSPASLAGALAALDPGADAAMHAAIAKTLGYPQEQAAPAIAAFQRAGVELGALPPGEGPLSFANAMFVVPGSGFKPEGFALLEAAGVEAHEANLGTDEGIVAVNDWVAERTAGLIPVILGQPLPEALLVALNALYFKDSWAEAFPADATAPGSFDLVGGATADVSMMHLPATELTVREDDAFVGVTLPFATPGFALTIVTSREGALPLAGFAPAAAWLSGAGFSVTEAELSLPKFSIEYGTDLLDAVNGLGLAEGAASPTAFETFGVAGVIGAIIQKTVIKVDEAGAEAAAATAVVMERGIGGGGPLSIFVDRPFLFSLTDETRGLVLLAGYVGRP
jgi:serine protease inhibitor